MEWYCPSSYFPVFLIDLNIWMGWNVLGSSNFLLWHLCVYYLDRWRADACVCLSLHPRLGFPGRISARVKRVSTLLVPAVASPVRMATTCLRSPSILSQSQNPKHRPQVPDQEKQQFIRTKPVKTNLTVYDYFCIWQQLNQLDLPRFSRLKFTCPKIEKFSRTL